jgi:hypothetical protein
MGKVELAYADESPCFFCNEKMPLKASICQSCDKEVPPRITVMDLLVAFVDGHIVDVRAGGLVLGRHHNDDDIPMYLPVAEGLLQICGVMQGGEYVVNKEATEKHVARIQEINSYKGDEEYKPSQSLSMTDTTRVFNTNGIKGELSVLMEGGQFIVNRAATIKHYEELEQINNSVTHELRGT